jgi:putative transposase
LVFVTKHRREVLAGERIDFLRGVFAKMCADFEAHLVETNGENRG